VAKARRPQFVDTLSPLIRAPRLSDSVVDQLLDSIIAWDLKPGDRLPSERELAEQFGVSRTVIREAARSLAARGIIEVRSGSGLTVAAADSAALKAPMNFYLRSGEIPYERIHEVRCAIEIAVVGTAAQRATDEEIDRLEHEQRRFREAVESGDLETCAALDVDFHRNLAEFTHNSLFVVILDSIGDVLLEIRRQTMGMRGRPRKATRQHERIVRALRVHDADAARQAMQEHLEDSFQAWLKLGRPVRHGATGP